VLRLYVDLKQLLLTQKAVREKSKKKMFPQFGATAESLSKASTAVFRIGTDAHLYDDPEDVNIAPLLDSRFDSEKCEALKRLLALIAQGFDVANFFPQVIPSLFPIHNSYSIMAHSISLKILHLDCLVLLILCACDTSSVCVFDLSHF
jgi:hypothetical protein